jgi:glycosyltransferase involved in cell wall biosynthesis
MDKSKSRILIVMHNAGTGGVEQSILTLCKFLNREHFEPILVFPSDGPLMRTFEDIGIKMITSPVEWLIPPKYIREKGQEEDYYYNKFLFKLNDRVRNLQGIIDSNGIDLVHSATLTVADGAIAARVSGVPHLWHIHGHYNADFDFLPITTVYSLVESLSAKVVAVSKSVRDSIGKYISCKGKIDVVYNGLDLEKLDKDRNVDSSLFREFPKLRDKKIICLIGRVYKIKGIDLFVDAAIKVLQERDDVAFLIVGPIGDRNLFNQMNEKIRVHNRLDSIVFAGLRDDVQSILKHVYLMVCASPKEGFPYVLLESMAASTPVLSTRCGGPEEVINHGETGYLLKKRDGHEMSDVIISLLDDEAGMNNIASAGRALVKDNFSAQKYANDFESIYRNVLDSPSDQYSEQILWKEIILNSLSSLGNLNKRLNDVENEMRGASNFISYFKDNFLYRAIKNICVTNNKK